ncbi:MAG: hypothetical protein JWM19_5631 [Actinomycetia bacterium]|nr:hypothetical protein [Actinomycetes bacterium]
MRDMSAFPTVVAVVLLAGGLAACSAQGTSTPPASPATSAPSASVVSSAQVGVIPWVNRPATQGTGAMTTPPYTTGARPCTPADLSVRPGTNGPAAGIVRFQVLFTNRSAATCWLNGYPASVAGIAATGAVTPLTAVHQGAPMDNAPSANIAPGQSAEVYLATGDACNAVLNGQHRIFRRLQFGLPGAAPGTTTGTVTGSGDGFDTECGLGVSEFGVPADLPVSPAPSPLTATITAPSAARTGPTLSYQVTLSNPTSKPFALSPCPSYAEYLGGAGGNVARYFYLNCAGAPSIPAHASVTFQVKLAVPASMKSMSSAKLDWQIQGGTGPAQASLIQVVG